MLDMEEVNCRIKQIKADLKQATHYPLNDTEEDELRVTGRTCISLENFEPFIEGCQRFLKAHQDAVWTLSLNIVSGDIEITIKGSVISL